MKLNRDLFHWADKEDHQVDAVGVHAAIIAAVRANASIKAIELVFPGEPHKLISLLGEFNIHASVVRSEAERAPPSYHQLAPDELPGYQDVLQPPEPAARPGYEAEMARRASLGEGAQAVEAIPVAEAPPEVAPNAVLDAMAPPLDRAPCVEALQRSIFSAHSPQYVAGLGGAIRSVLQWISNPAVSDMVKLRELSVLVSSLARHGAGEHQHVDSGIATVFECLKTQLPALSKPGQAPLVPEMTRTIEAWHQGFNSRIAARQEHNIAPEPSPAEGEPQPPEGAAPSALSVAPNAIAGAAAQTASLEASVAALYRRFVTSYSPLHLPQLENELRQVLSGLSSPAVPDDKKLEHLPALVNGLGRLVHAKHGDLQSASEVATFFRAVAGLPILNKPGLEPRPAMISGMKMYCAEVQSRHLAKQERDQKAASEAQQRISRFTPNADGVSLSQVADLHLLLKEVHACGNMFKTGVAIPANEIRIRNLIDTISNWDCPPLQLKALDILSEMMCLKPDANPKDSAKSARRLWPSLLVAAQNIHPRTTFANQQLQSSVISRLTAPHSYS